MVGKPVIMSDSKKTNLNKGYKEEKVMESHDCLCPEWTWHRRCYNLSKLFKNDSSQRKAINIDNIRIPIITIKYSKSDTSLSNFCSPKNLKWTWRMRVCGYHPTYQCGKGNHSNSSLICCTRFHINALWKGMKPLFLPHTQIWSKYLWKLL